MSLLKYSRYLKDKIRKGEDMNNKRVLLCIMDGWGIDNQDDETNAVKLSKEQNVQKLEKEEIFTTIHADGEYVGLPAGQMGNSEVGHLNLGAGRIVYQDLSKINNAIKDGSFFKNEKFIKNAKILEGSLKMWQKTLLKKIKKILAFTKNVRILHSEFD